MKSNQERAQTALYLLLLAIQIVGAIAFVWQGLPEFRQVLTNPGEQLPRDASSDLMTAGIFSPCKSRSGSACSAFRFRFDV